MLILVRDLPAQPEEITVHLDAGYDSHKTRQTLTERGLRGQIAHKGEKAPIQASQRWHVERTRHGHRRAQPDPASMDDSPLGRTPEPPTMTHAYPRGL